VCVAFTVSFSMGSSSEVHASWYGYKSYEHKSKSHKGSKHSFTKSGAKHHAGKHEEHKGYDCEPSNDPVPPVGTNCSACDGKIDTMVLRYDGDEPRVQIEVYGRNSGLLFASLRVAQFQNFAISGAEAMWDRFGTLGPAIEIYINGELVGDFHTSCSVPIGPGSTTADGDIVVISASSRNGGATCPVATIPSTPST